MEIQDNVISYDLRSRCRSTAAGNILGVTYIDSDRGLSLHFCTRSRVGKHNIEILIVQILRREFRADLDRTQYKICRVNHLFGRLKILLQNIRNFALCRLTRENDYDLGSRHNGGTCFRLSTDNKTRFKFIIDLRTDQNIVTVLLQNIHGVIFFHSRIVRKIDRTRSSTDRKHEYIDRAVILHLHSGRDALLDNNTVRVVGTCFIFDLVCREIVFLKVRLNLNDRLSNIVLNDEYTLRLLLYGLFQSICNKICKTDQNSDDQNDDHANDNVILPSGSSSRLDGTLDIFQFAVVRLLTDRRSYTCCLVRFFWRLYIRINDTERTVRIDHQGIKFRDHITDRLITKLRILLHCLLDDRVKSLRNTGDKIGSVRNRLLKVLHGNSHGVFTIKRNSSGHHLEKRNAKRVNIGAWADDAASCLLRRKIVNRTDRAAGCERDRMIGRRVRDTEVRYLSDTVSCNKDIVRFNITMNDTVLVRGIKCHTYLDKDRNSDFPVEMTVLQDHVFYGDTFNILLDHITDTAFLTDTEYVNDIGV